MTRKQGSGSTGASNWTRCGNSAFYQPSWQGSEDLEVVFVDPVDLVLIMSSATRGGGIEVVRSHLKDLTPEMVQEYYYNALGPVEGRPFLLWIGGLVTALEEREEFKADLLRRMDNAKKDVRAKTLEALEDFIIRNIPHTHDEERSVQATPEALWEALGEFGIHEC